MVDIQEWLILNNPCPVGGCVTIPKFEPELPNPGDMAGPLLINPEELDSLDAFQEGAELGKQLGQIAPGAAGEAGYTTEEWNNRTGITEVWGSGECMACAGHMNVEFGDSIYTIKSGAPQYPLKGPGGEDIAAPAGWHTVAVDDKGNAWDNWGFRGPANEYFDAMQAQNRGAQVSGPFDNIGDADANIEQFLKPWK